jgi:imidazolonepropionase-like amidohydrolase
VLLDCPNMLHLVYHYGINPVAAVVKNGQVVHRVPGF